MRKICIRSMVLGIGIGLILVATLNLIFQYKSNTLQSNADDASASSGLEASLQNMKKDMSEAGITNEDTGNNSDIIPQEDKGEDIKVSDEETGAGNDPPYEIRISRGMTSETIADLLLENDVIDNRQEFIDLAIELKMTKQFKYGIKLVPRDATLKEIIEILTKVD